MADKSETREDWYPVTTAHVGYKITNIPPNSKLRSPQMQGIDLTINTTANTDPIRLVLPIDTAKDLHADLGTAIIRAQLQNSKIS